ncbi:uncharacterized protein LOC111890084 [Lactuca sativa]|uniref:uncharacterized protein LOC111890084 n=1 Tax=Lactuca sativa TaxID=4236 RepID=UPI0022AF21ED|nr:uncharacterized protein LOC111890084 [Lactuca sativa]
MSVEEVIGRLKAYEERMKCHVEPEDRKLLMTYQQWSEKNKKKSEADSNAKANRGGFNSSRDRGRGRGGRGRGVTIIREAKEFGHYATKCKKPKKERNQEANLVHDDNELALLLAAFEEIGEVFLNEERVKPEVKRNGGALNQSKVRYLDTGASNHMTGDKEKFQTLDKKVHGVVKFGNESKVRIEGKGLILLHCKNGEERKLRDVYYIPDLCSNIISLRQLSEGDDEIRIKEPFLWVHDDTGRLLMKVKKSPNRLYKIQLEEVTPRCMIANLSGPKWSWHMRLGHVNFTSLKAMADKGLIEGTPKVIVP